MRLSSRSARSRAVVLLGAVPILLAACGGASPEQVRAGPVAEAAGATLAGAPLERWLLASPYRPARNTAAAMISSWIDNTLLATAMQKGPAIDDSATVDAAILPDAERGMSRDYWKVRADARPTVTDREADSLIALDHVRIFQRLVILVPPGADSATKTAAVIRAHAVLKRAQGGTDFTALVREFSQDSVGKVNGGYMPGMTRDAVPQQIAPAVWSLHPGEFSPLLQTPVGIQILRRATPAEARPGLRAWLTPVVGRRADSLFLDSLTIARHLKVVAGAPARLRALAEEPVNAPEGPALVSWDGGALSPALARKWLMMVTPAERGQLAVASDSTSGTYLRELGQRELIIGLAMPGGMAPKARVALAPAFRHSITLVEADLRRIGGAGSPGEMSVVYLDSVTAGKASFRLLPGALASVLRTRYPVNVDYAAVDRMVKVAAAEWDVKRAAEPAGSAALRRP